MKKTAIELLNLVLFHCNITEVQTAFITLQEIENCDHCDQEELRNIIISCLDDLKHQFNHQ